MGWMAAKGIGLLRSLPRYPWLSPHRMGSALEHGRDQVVVRWF